MDLKNKLGKIESRDAPNLRLFSQVWHSSQGHKAVEINGRLHHLKGLAD